MTVNAPVGVHGGWAQEHQYWLYCMEFVKNTAEHIPFRIEGDYLHVNTGSGFKQIFNRY